MLARDLMSQPVITIRKTDSLEAAARAMVEHGIGCLPVVDGDGTLVGILTESDFQAQQGFAPFSLFEMPKLFGRLIDVEGVERIYQEARATPVERLMQGHPAKLAEDASIEKVAALMLQRSCHHIPIVRDGRPVGIIARRDLLRILANAPRKD